MRLYEDLRAVQSRLATLETLVVGLLVVLLVQFWNLQVVRGRHFQRLAENNRTRVVSLAAPRGALLDREGRVLVGNRASFNVVLTPEHAENLDLVVTRLAGTLGIGEARIRELIARRAPLRPLVVKADASVADVAVLEARRLELPEVSIEVVPLRSYPLAAAAAHALGRVGEITQRQLRQEEFVGLRPGSLIGQAGVEARYNRELMGEDGYRRVVVNSRGLEVAEAERQPPSDGPSLRLALDASLQTAMERAFAGRAGAAAALDPRTGEILAMTSTPAYDPNDFTTGIEASDWARLATDPATPLMNRVIQGQYAPGSVFKVVMAVAGLEEGAITPATRIYCPGYLAVYNRVFHCNVPSGHGVVDVRQALAHSCNVFFYQLGIRLEIGRIAKWAKRMGLGAPTGVDLPHEAGGLVPSPEWKLRAQGLPWYPGETVSVAIGQGQMTATPLQLARLASVIASGRLQRPSLVPRVPAEPGEALPIQGSTLAVVRDGMRASVAEGTGWRARLRDIAVCGKTGSAQVVARARLEQAEDEERLQPHGWFVAFAPAGNPTIALAVLVEHSGSGGLAAAPVARRILVHHFGLSGDAQPGEDVAGVDEAAGG
jgi:penicillin-binding protein 2